MPIKFFLYLIPIWFLLLSCKKTKYKTKLTGKTVEIVEKNGKYQLYRKGSPYFIKGAIGNLHFGDIKKAGGNSIRIYDTENAEELLDKAQELGLTVTLGLKVAKAKTELNYSDEKAVQAQLHRLKKEVQKFKNHPALLMWGIGNEPTLHVRPSFTRPGSIIMNIRTLLAINDIARMVHEVDPNHPTTTMLQGVPPKKTTSFINLFCPEIDILSFNIFMPLKNNDVPALIKEKGWNGPFILSEYGTIGYWFNIPQTEWYAVYEKTSTEKANFIRKVYRKYILSNTDKCLGSYAFYWGQKNEFTPTWFSLFTEDGKPTEVIDALSFLWTNKWPANRAPCIRSLKINKRHPLENIYIKAGENFTASISTEDAERENLTLKWELAEDENNKFFNSVYNQKKAKIIQQGEFSLWQLKNTADKSNKAGNNFYNLKFKAPDTEGSYRLFMFVEDENNKVATANVPFYVLPKP